MLKLYIFIYMFVFLSIFYIIIRNTILSIFFFSKIFYKNSYNVIIDFLYKIKVFPDFIEIVNQEKTMLIQQKFGDEKYRFFEKKEESNSWGKEVYLELVNDLEEEKEKTYNDKFPSDSYSALECYCGYSYKMINNYLRYDINVGLEKVIKRFIKFFDNLFDKHKVPESVIVVRWIGYNRLLEMRLNEDDIEEKSILLDKGYMSSSLSLEYNSLPELIERNRTLDRVLLIIKVPKGSNAIFVNEISRRSRESEILIDKNSKLIVNKVLYKKDKKYILFCELLGNNETKFYYI